MAIDKVWVLAEAGDAGPTPITLELLTEARSIGSTVEAVAWGAEVASLAAGLGEYGATTVYDVGDLGGALPGVPVASAIAALVAGGGELSSQHPVFGGSEIVTARFTGPGPGIFVIRAKSFTAEPSGDAPA